MEKEPSHNQIEQQKTRRFGADISVRNYWIRHAQKMSGDIINAEKTSLSPSAISEAGEEASQEYGEGVVAGKHGAKGYVSRSERTAQTLEKILEGYQKTNPDKSIRSMKIREELTSETPKKFLALYDKKFNEQKKVILDEKGITENDFSTLSPDEQEQIAEFAEEPVIREWLDNPKSELVKLFPPSQAAARFARLFNRRHERIAGKLYSGSEVDLFHITHKTITEPFLTSGVLIRKTDGERITKLEQLGGSLETLGDWESEVTTDNAGNASIVVKIRGEEYNIDQAVLEHLLQQQIEKEDEKQ